MVHDRFRLRYRLTPEHIQKLGRLALARARKPGDIWRLALPSWGLMALLSVAFAVLSDLVLHWPYSPVSFVGGLVVALIYIKFTAWLCARQVRRNLTPTHTATGEFSLAAYDGGGIQITGKHVTSSYEWSAFLDVSETDNMLVLWVDHDRGVIIPDCAFANEEEKQQFIAYVTERIKAQQEKPAPSS